MTPKSQGNRPVRRVLLALALMASPAAAQAACSDRMFEGRTFTVCDAAAAEECAPWPGQPMTAHWGVPDPVKATGTDAEKGLAFASAFSDLNRRITAFAALSIDQLDRLALQRSLDTIGLNHP